MTKAQSLRAAVIGLGRMGMHHVRACEESVDVELVAVLDHKPDWAVTVGADTHSLVAADLDSLIGKIDIAIIAVPTADHALTANPLLRAGVSCLVEKPIALTEKEAMDMITVADEGGAILQIGHIERFNPAVRHLALALEKEKDIQRITVRRHNMISDRDYDIDAVLDLMTHDLDLLDMFSITDIETIDVDDDGNHHRLLVTMASTSGADIALSVDRDAEERVRDLVIETARCSYHLDFSAQKIARQSDSGTEELPVEPNDALRDQLKAFVTAVRTGHESGATGLHGLKALELANRVREKAGLL